jgi:hypothetical protein
MVKAKTTQRMVLCEDCCNGDCDSCYESDCPCNLTDHRTFHPEEARCPENGKIPWGASSVVGHCAGRRRAWRYVRNKGAAYITEGGELQN